MYSNLMSIEQITAAARAVEHAQAELDQALADRATAMSAARAAGHTWRAVAAAAGLTEMGARKALARAKEAAPVRFH